MLNISKEDFFKNKTAMIIGLWYKKGEFDKEVRDAFIGVKFGVFPWHEVENLNRFEMSDSLEKGKKGFIVPTWEDMSLPALWIRFEDPDNPGNWYTGTINGKENILEAMKRLS